MAIKYPCKECPNQYVRIVMRGLVTCHVACTSCGFIMQVEKIRVKMLERQQEATICDFCFEPLGVSIVYDHGKKLHPDCFIKKSEKSERREDWSKGLYEE